MLRAQVKPDMIRWARERCGLPADKLQSRFKQLDGWESGEVMPTLKQLEAFARAVWVPVGYLFLQDPPVETVPIPDFRSGRSSRGQPSPNLLDTVYVCQARQSWYHDFARSTAEPARAYVGSLTTSVPVEAAAAAIRTELQFDLDARRDYSTWTDALRSFIAQAERAGIMVMCSGVVFNNNNRKLDPEEFRGFAIVDSLAPLVFINGADTKAAQMFTLAHELAHVWLGQSAVSNADLVTIANNSVETWCNRVAAETLVPLAVLRTELRVDEPVGDTMNRLARRFKVSTLVILRRLFDAGAITRESFEREYKAELSRLAPRASGSGGDFYLTQAARVSRRFASALVESTLEGQTLYRDAFRMLGISKLETFKELGHMLGVTA